MIDERTELYLELFTFPLVKHDHNNIDITQMSGDFNTCIAQGIVIQIYCKC